MQHGKEKNGTAEKSMNEKKMVHLRGQGSINTVKK